ncbi:MAG TPA: hypothetical protein VMB85_07855 [Bryobacteraceae bacterium]|jgi:hypothetical protein|nr:hypothetical protein [Bryobacteraceae bacterium]
MGVFNNSVKIGVRVEDPGTDKKLPPSGALSYPSITAPSALAGTTGIDCKLVHGDRWQQILGNMTENYTDNVNTTVGQNWTIQVNGIMNLTVMLGYNETEWGPVNRTYQQVVNDTFNSDHNVSIPDSAAFTVTNFANTFTWVTSIAIVFGLSMPIAIALCVTIAAVYDLEYKTLHAEAHPIHGSWAGISSDAEISDEHFKALRAAVGTEAQVQATINCLLDLDSATPMT